MQANIHYSQIPAAMVACYQLGMDLNLRIREIRKSKGLSLAEVAARVSVSVPHLSEVERGKKNLNNHLLIRLADALDVKPDLLIASKDREELDRFAGVLAGLDPADQQRVLDFATALRASGEASKQSEE